MAGAILVAVAIEQMIAYSSEAVHLPTVLVAAAGPLIFLVGSALFHRSLAAKSVATSHLLAGSLVVAWAWLALEWHLHGLWLGVGILIIMTILAISSSKR